MGDLIEHKIKAIDAEPTFNVSKPHNNQAQDKENTSLTQEEALQNASTKKDGFFVTKGVFADE